MVTFKVQLRAIKHLTREITVDAETKISASILAQAMTITHWDESEAEDIQVESVEPAPAPHSPFEQLPSAMSNRVQHFVNLNAFRDYRALGMFWQIDEDIYEEFLNMLPPQYCAGGFRMIEKLTGDIAATFLRVGPEYWCGYTDRETVEPHRLLNHIHRFHP